MLHDLGSRSAQVAQLVEQRTENPSSPSAATGENRLTAAFAAKIQFGPSCWLWTGSRDRNGYGWCYKPGVRGTFRAHRVAWEIARGAIPAGKVVMHSCDTPSCVRPSHLRLGSQAENIADRDAKGRTQKGDRHYKRKAAHSEARLLEAIRAAAWEMACGHIREAEARRRVLRLVP